MAILVSTKINLLGDIKSIHACKRPGCNGTLVDNWGENRCFLCNREHDQNGELVKLIDPVAENINCRKVDHDKYLGVKGGRPRSMTLDEIRQRQSLEAQNNKNGGNRLPNNRRELMEMWKLKNKMVGQVS